VGFVLRSLRIGVLCLASALVPLGMGFGMWGWSIGSIGLPGAVIIALTIGIIVDDAIHFLHKYQEALSIPEFRYRPLEYAFEYAGQAIVYTTIALCSGFGVLLLSGFEINEHLGILTCMILISALAFDLLVLPGLLTMNPAAASEEIALKGASRPNAGA